MLYILFHLQCFVILILLSMIKGKKLNFKSYYLWLKRDIQKNELILGGAVLLITAPAFLFFGVLYLFVVSLFKTLDNYLEDEKDF